MAVFPFTVRATDSEGSYADRQFNITVRNSRVERFMVVDNDDAWTSPDGTSWTKRVGQGGFTCAYGNGFWMVIKTGSAFSLTKSTDGINYSLVNQTAMTFLDEGGQNVPVSQLQLPFATTAKLKFFNGRFYIIMQGANTYDLWSTADGIAWQRKRLCSSVTSSMSWNNSSSYTTNYLMEDNGQLIIPYPTGDINGISRQMGWITSDGVTFTRVTNASNTSGDRGASYLTRFNGLWIAMNTYHNNVSFSTTSGGYLYSTDGLNWSQGSINSFDTSWSPTVPIYVNGTIYVFPRKSSANGPGLIHTSVDGLNWSVVNYKVMSASGTTFTPRFVYKNGLFILVANTMTGTSADPSLLGSPQASYRISVDGVNWTSVNYQDGAALSSNDIAAM